MQFIPKEPTPTAQEQARGMTDDAHARVLDYEKAEKEAWSRLISGAMGNTEAGLAELIADANLAYAARVQAQIHYANCRAHLRMTWEERNEDFPRPFSVVEVEK